MAINKNNGWSMLMLKKISIYLLCLVIGVLSTSININARESYEDYMERKSKKDSSVIIKRDKPLSEIDPSEKESILDELRGAVREELDQSLKEEKLKKKKVSESQFVEEVRAIIREEIEDAIKIKQSRYLKKWTVEIGICFLSGKGC